MSAPIRTDALSLTLPKALGRARAKRREKPPWIFWVFLAFVVWFGVLAVWAFTSGEIATGIVDLLGVGLYWRIALACKAGQPPRPYLPFQIALVGLSVIGAFLP